MEQSIRNEMNAAARDFVYATTEYTFTERERRALAPFFSNHEKKIFFLSGLPESVSATLLAMYSRLKNPRGLRGHFVDHLVPVLMFAGVSEDDPRFGDWKGLLKSWRVAGLTGLDAICTNNSAFNDMFEEFVAAAGRPEYWRVIADSKRISDFKNEHLDTYGHNSIARPARLLLCAEGVSILVAKILEETWPGTAFIELSTRYVDFSGASQYPVWLELALVDKELGVWVHAHIDDSVDEYKRLIGDKFNGLFPSFLRSWASHLVSDAKDLESGIIGESCDVLGNLLPCSTLTELGLSVSGEALGDLLKNLRLENSPECLAVAAFIEDETNKAGHSYFLRHHEPTPWEIATRTYLTPTHIKMFDVLPEEQVQSRILNPFNCSAIGSDNIKASFASLLTGLKKIPRGEFDKLPKQFRVASVMSQDTMSYRSWRDTQRMSLSVHLRSRVTPFLGFYRYPKSRCHGLDEVFARTHGRDSEFYPIMKTVGVPAEMAEYPMAMGNLVTYQIISDLRQAEFCGWQRSKWGVNDEVRQAFLSVEYNLRTVYPWWAQLSRADLTSHYAFARGKVPIVLPEF